MTQITKLKSPKLGINDNKGLKLKLSAFKLSIWWPIYIINSVDNTKLPCYTLQVTQQHSFRNLPRSSIHKLYYLLLFTQVMIHCFMKYNL